MEDKRELNNHVHDTLIECLSSKTLIALLSGETLAADDVDKVSEEEKKLEKHCVGGKFLIFCFFQGIKNCVAAIKLIDRHRLDISISADQDAALRILNKLRLSFEFLNSLLYQRKRQLSKDESNLLKTEVQVHRINSSKQEVHFLGTYLLRIVQIDETHIFLEIISKSDGKSFLVYPLLQGVSVCFKTVDNQIILPDFQEEGCELGFVLSPTDYAELVYVLNDILVEGAFETEESHQSKDEDEKKLPRSRRDLVLGATLTGMRMEHSASNGAGKIDTFRSYLTSFFPKAVDAPPVSDTVRNGIAVIREGSDVAADQSTAMVKISMDSLKTYGAFLVPTSTAPEAASKGFIRENLGDLATAFSITWKSYGTSSDILRNSMKDNTEQGVTHIWGESHGAVSRDLMEILDNYSTVSGNVIVTPKNVLGHAVDSFTDERLRQLKY